MEDFLAILKEHIGEARLEKELNEIFEQVKTVTLPGIVTLTEEQINYIKGIAISRIRTQYRKELAPNPNEKLVEEAIIIGSNEKRDMEEQTRKLLLEEYRKNPTNAVTKGMVRIEDGKVVPLYWMDEEAIKKSPDWMTKRLGKPMPEKNIARNVIGILNEDSKWIEFALKLRDKVCDVIIPNFSVVTFKGIKTQNSTTERIQFVDSGKLSIEIKKKLSEKEIVDLFTNGLKNKNIELINLRTWIENVNNRGSYMIARVFITEIYPDRVTSDGRPLQTIRIEDASIGWKDEQGNVMQPITCFLPQHIQIDCPEGSEIFIIGVPKVKEDNAPTINVLGMYVFDYCRNTIPKRELLEEKKQGKSIPKVIEKVSEGDIEW